MESCQCHCRRGSSVRLLAYAGILLAICGRTYGLCEYGQLPGAMVTMEDGTQKWKINDPNCQLEDLLAQHLSRNGDRAEKPLNVLLLGGSADRLVLNDLVYIAEKVGLPLEQGCSHDEHGSACIKLPQLNMVYKLVSRVHTSSDSDSISTPGSGRKALKLFAAINSITIKLKRNPVSGRADDVTQAFEILSALTNGAEPDIVIVSPPRWDSSRKASEIERHLGEDEEAMAQWVEETSNLLEDVEELAPPEALLVYHDYTAWHAFESERVEASVASHVQPATDAAREVAEARPGWKILDLSLMLPTTADGHHHSAHDAQHPSKSVIMLQAFNICLNLFRQHSLAREAAELEQRSSMQIEHWKNAPPLEYDQMDEFGKRAHRIWQHAAHDGLVLWTLANFSWLDYVLNWVAMVRAAGIEHFFVASLDEELERELLRRGIPCESMNSTLGSADLGWGSDTFKERGREKIRFIHTMLKAGMSPMFSDLDVVWLRNPLPFVRQFSTPNVLISSDTLIPALEPGNQLDSCMQTVGDVFFGMGRMNVGIHMLRPSAIPLAEAWLDKMSNTNEMEQMCWNLVVLEGLHNLPGVNDTELYCGSLEDKVTIGLLPITLFQNGHTYFSQRLHELVGVEPYAVHASFVGGFNNKRHHFQEGLMWQVDPPEHFNPPNGLLTFDLDVPSDMLRNATPPEGAPQQSFVSMDLAMAHVKLAQHQLRQLRIAMAVADALGRGIVLPQLWCGLDNLWGPHPGRAWDTLEYVLPFACPLAHQVDVERAYHARDVDQSIPFFFESSLLRNSRMADNLGGTVNVTSCQEVSSCAQRKGIVFAGRLNETAIQAILPDAVSAPIIHFTNIMDAWGGFVTPGKATNLTDAFNGITRPWCCTEVEGQSTDMPLMLEPLGGP